MPRDHDLAMARAMRRAVLVLGKAHLVEKVRVFFVSNGIPFEKIIFMRPEQVRNQIRRLVRNDIRQFIFWAPKRELRKSAVMNFSRQAQEMRAEFQDLDFHYFFS